MTSQRTKKKGRKLLNSVVCPKCRLASPTRSEAIEHIESRHGDYKSLRTRQEYLEFIETHIDAPEYKGDADELRKLAKSIPYNYFLSKAALQRMKKRGIA